MNHSNSSFMGRSENLFIGVKNRLLQLLARFSPGHSTTRVKLHRWRGVHIGVGVSIGYDVILETACPEWISLGNNVQVGMRSLLIAHMTQMRGLPWNHRSNEFTSIRIEDDVHLGPGVIVLPKITIGRGSVVAAGSVVTRSIPPLTFVQGNPAKPVARCGIPLLANTDWNEFVCNLRPIRPTVSAASAPSRSMTHVEDEESAAAEISCEIGVI